MGSSLQQKVLAIIICGLSGVPLVSQSREKIRPDLPASTLESSLEDDLPVLVPSPMVEGIIGCTADGSFVVNSILPVDPKSSPPTAPHVLSVISPTGKVQNFDFAKIADLRDISTSRAYDVGSRDVDFLVYAVDNNRENTSVDKSMSGSHVGRHSFFVARFDRDGVYRGWVELEIPRLAPLKIGVFDDGDLLVFGVDEENRQAKLVRFSPTGGHIFYYQPDTSFVVKNETLPSSFAKGENPGEDRIQLSQLRSAVQVSQILHFKDSLLLFQMNAGAPLYQIFANGSIRTIPLPKLDGFTADSLVGSDDLLYVRYRRTGTNTGQGDDGVILQVSPSTGDPLRLIHPGEFTVWDVSCVHQNNFRVVRLKDENTFNFLHAQLKPSSP